MAWAKYEKNTYAPSLQRGRPERYSSYKYSEPFKNHERTSLSSGIISISIIYSRCSQIKTSISLSHARLIKCSPSRTLNKRLNTTILLYLFRATIQTQRNILTRRSQIFQWATPKSMLQFAFFAKSEHKRFRSIHSTFLWLLIMAQAPCSVLVWCRFAKATCSLHPLTQISYYA